MATHVRRNPEVLVTSLDNETVLLNPANRQLFTLNAPGVLIWQHLEDGTEAIVRMLTARFDVTPTEARADAIELIGALKVRDLVIEA